MKVYLPLKFPSKPLLLMHAGVILGLSTAVFMLKYKVAELQRTCKRLDAAIIQEEEMASILKAEWSYLTRLERMERLAAVYTPTLEPLKPQDILDLRPSATPLLPCP